MNNQNFTGMWGFPPSYYITEGVLGEEYIFENDMNFLWEGITISTL